MSDLTYISKTEINNYTSIEDLKVDIIKTLSRWFPNHYVFNEHAMESWTQKEGTDIYILHNNIFEIELSIYGVNVYNLVMFGIGRYRRQGSSYDFFESIMNCLEYQLRHPDIEFVTMADSSETPYTFWNFEPQIEAVSIAEVESLEDEVDQDDESDEDEDGEDIQKMLVEEGDKWISLFNELIESNECMSLKYQCLIEPVTKIIQNETALAKMCKLDNLFSYTYIQHFHIKENTFSLVSDPYISMCMEIVMRRYQ